MIKFKDFFPTAESYHSFRGPKKPESLHDTMKLANNWINSNSIEFINIETIILPHDSGRLLHEGASSHKGYYFLGQGGYFRQGVRVWYREK